VCYDDFMNLKKRIKVALAVVILVVTVGLFIRYASAHPEILRKLSETNPLLLAALVLLYCLWFLAIVLIMRISLRMVGKGIGRQENLLLNAYSSLLNFFGPGQSGPAMRGLYLYKRHQVRIKDYMFITLVGYGFYAVISALFLFIGSRPWWQTLGLVVAAGGGSFVFIRWYAARSKIQGGPGFNLANFGLLFAATALQLIVQFFIYFIELSSVNDGVGVGQALAYTGAANFALFVALTPGAIGIREGFLIFSQNLHHLGNAAIVAANVIDRAAYLLFLGVLFILVLSLHAKDKLRWGQIQQESAPTKTTQE
jgi:uncharacterized membrane protein YbhN (UPF0104 family)